MYSQNQFCMLGVMNIFTYVYIHVILFLFMITMIDNFVHVIMITIHAEIIISSVYFVTAR